MSQGFKSIKSQMLIKIKIVILDKVRVFVSCISGCRRLEWDLF